ncbi:MAG: hypothetical protein COZ31_01445 [Nitrospirae bacterium CG_4_10_14_3_um_filter_44_29]|nr:MAG: hypothetical protein COS10_02915 [Nitrospirae bacterium CG01_land_8_20_14_3_00_44_22]PIX89551.1 MAG: hypothetical protein COZ31_01445 [Nitrospirae bacterium CG_4_10_14_3_um_filter_44_29]
MKPFTKIAIAVFSLVAVLHLLRVIFGWEVIVSGIIIPLWISVVGFIIAAGLAVLLWREMKGR